jgi:AcrR family transcriptional regulator
VSHEVVKSVKGREYRYRVESYRDPESGKVRGRWTYLGRVEGGRLTAPDARRPAQTRERLLDALSALLDRREFAEVTVSEIAAAAGLAHGTFYRYFKDKQAALRAAAVRVRENIERSRPDFEAPLGSLSDERARIRAWVESTMRGSIDHPGLLREWYAMLARDPELQAEWVARRAATSGAFARYFERLGAAGLIRIERPGELAEALRIAVDGAFRGLALTGEPFSPATIAGFRDLFDRAIFPGAAGTAPGAAAGTAPAAAAEAVDRRA